MNKEEIDYGLAIEGLQKPDGLRELAKIQLNKMVENSREQYIKSLQQENKQLKDNWNKLKEIINTSRVSKGIFFDDGDVLIGIKNMIDKIESGDSNE